jgi:hypothetical protein
MMMFHAARGDRRLLLGGFRDGCPDGLQVLAIDPYVAHPAELFVATIEDARQYLNEFFALIGQLDHLLAELVSVFHPFFSHYFEVLGRLPRGGDNVRYPVVPVLNALAALDALSLHRVAYGSQLLGSALGICLIETGILLARTNAVDCPEFDPGLSQGLAIGYSFQCGKRIGPFHW